ncbi:MAG: Rpn family recombination-promoting nuclease/putative transposase [Okeania sp. SIO3I5]|uniref:Rpn family recombination-promoting nuclease/putative transposase n=1 Tax=Okeania sp. SIO3I5 TaxID=2607805 RepID=UPI0013BB8E2A|nr:Rpn family recombination-promoting nuclease/putative transposase [Okeania sp. SIO3I5]NEQ38720.1 Rpn family recombination-promoting nuclease/putative transposase [Okeania sp. SIO3I5]
MKTDHIFYRIFQDLPETFFQLWGELPENLNDYRFDSVELKQTYFRIDGVFLPQDVDKPIYFTEVQFQKDEKIYLRLFSEIFTYLRDNDPELRWRAMIIFKSRSFEPTEKQRESVQPLLDSPLVKRIYLNELKVSETTPLGVQIVQLVVARKKQFLERVTVLIDRVKQQFTEENYRLQLLNLLSVIVLEKLPQMSRQELEAMFGIDDLKKTRFAQELMAESKIEAKLEIIPSLLKKSFSVEEIAEILELEIEQVRQAIAKLN